MQMGKCGSLLFAETSAASGKSMEQRDTSSTSDSDGLTCMPSSCVQGAVWPNHVRCGGRSWE